MEQISLFFTSTFGHLGELVTRDGAFVQIRLSQEGESRLGKTFAAWQTNGVSKRKDVIKIGKDGFTQIVAEEQILPKSAGFFSAVWEWARREKILMVTCNTQPLECWERILKLPLSNQERYAMVSAASRLPATDIAQWMFALDDAAHAIKA
jgi:hypothetical protein